MPSGLEFLKFLPGSKKEIISKSQKNTQEFSPLQRRIKQGLCVLTIIDKQQQQPLESSIHVDTIHVDTIHVDTILISNHIITILSL